MEPMNLKELHERFKDNDSPSVEGQIRWLQKQGFAQHQIQQAILMVYSAIKRNEIPFVFHKKEERPDGGVDSIRVFGLEETTKPGEEWSMREIVSGEELDNCLLWKAKGVRTAELTSMVRKMEEFELDLRKKWEQEQNKQIEDGIEKKIRKKWYKLLSNGDLK